MKALADQGFLDINGVRIEYRMIGPRPEAAPTLVLLHEGLGSVAIWGDFAQKLSQATGLGVFSYSRQGYGNSSKVVLPRAVTFMHEEARLVLPKILDAIGFRSGILIGHSDGGSIAAIYGGSFQDHRVLGLVLIAAHFFTEEMGLAEIRRARESFERGELRTRLARAHTDPDGAFWSWCRPWLDPEFTKWNLTEELAHIRVPILLIQGEQDQYGTVKQIEVAQVECYCPVEVTLLPNTRHAPHRESPEATLATIKDFVARVLQNQQTGAFKTLAR
jgi:pimeloyl-ACP methyl ester carboxylesterase